MEKFELRNQVRNAVETMLTFNESRNIIINNLKLSVDRCGCSDLFEADFELRKYVNGKWMLIETFYVSKYACDHWHMVTEPWVCELITDITNLVELHIEEPKKRGW